MEPEGSGGCPGSGSKEQSRCGGWPGLKGEAALVDGPEAERRGETGDRTRGQRQDPSETEQENPSGGQAGCWQ